EGVRMVRDNLVKVLQEVGLQEIPSKGRVFDPYEMDCIEQVPDPEMKDGAVKSVVRKGYRLHDRVLRPAQVIVVKNRGETNGEDYRNRPRHDQLRGRIHGRGNAA